MPERTRSYTEDATSLPGYAGAALPHDKEAERAILSAMLLSPDVLQECLVSLKEHDFYLYSHKVIFRAMSELFNRGEAVVPVTLADLLKSQGNLDKAGGINFLIELSENSFSLAAWQHYIEILHRDSTLRELIEAASKITALAFDAPQDTKEVVDSAENMLLNVTNREIGDGFADLGTIMGDLYNELSDLSQNPHAALGVQTGYVGIDQRLQGLRPGQVIVIGARPGVGKTSFALNLAINTAATGASVVFFSLEMSKAEIAQRLLSAQAKIPLSDIRGARIKNEQWPSIMEATSQLSSLDIMIDDTPGTTVTEIRAKARRALKDKPNAIIMIDYLQLLESPASARNYDSRATEVAAMSRAIKIMAKDLEVPVVALSQLNRESTNRTSKRPQLSDLRESGAIEQDADIVILLDRSMTEEEAGRNGRPDLGVTDFIIAKNRSGPLDTVPLVFLANSTKFVEMDIAMTNQG